MTSIRFTPNGTHATVTFPLEDSDSQPKNGGTARLSWDIAVKGTGSVRLSAGGTLNEIEGRVFVAVGDADPRGKTVLEGEDAPCWGALFYFETGPFNIHVYVSRELFDRLLRLIELAHVPEFELQFPLHSPIKYGREPYVTHWDNAAHERVIFSDCNFYAEFGAGTLRGDRSE